MKKLNKSDFINLANNIHQNKYDYSLTDYRGNKNKIKIVCHEHGIFEQRPDVHIYLKQGCPKCRYIKSAKSNRKNIDVLIQEFKNIHSVDQYDYSLIKEYKNNKTKLPIICPKHGIFQQTPNHHLKGVGCPKCKSSKGEQTIIKYLTNNQINFVHNHKFDNCKHKRKLPFDFYLPDHNLCIEYDGEQHFGKWNSQIPRSSFKNIKIRDNIKNNFCFESGIKLIRIPYTRFKEIHNILNQELKLN